MQMTNLTAVWGVKGHIYVAAHDVRDALAEARYYRAMGFSVARAAAAARKNYGMVPASLLKEVLKTDET